jgi:hypothetical protein
MGERAFNLKWPGHIEPGTLPHARFGSPRQDSPRRPGKACPASAQKRDALRCCLRGWDSGDDDPNTRSASRPEADHVSDREQLLDELRPGAFAIAYRRHVEDRRPRFQTTREQHDELTARFFAAVQHGDLAKLEALLARDVEMAGDGGGKVPAFVRPIRGRTRVARTLVDSIIPRLSEVSFRLAEVNGGPGALYLDAQQRLIGVVALDFTGDQITSINSIVNPEKLTHLGPPGDVRSLLKGAR